ASGQVVPLAGLVSRWTGDGTAQDAAGSNHGAIHGGVLYTYTGARLTQGFQLNGTDSYIDVPETATLWPSGSFTVDAFFKSTDDDGVIASHYECGGPQCPPGGGSDWTIILATGNVAIQLRE